MQIRWFVCPYCREKMCATKNSRYATPRGHRKTMWCWKCKTYRPMIQINQ